MALIQGGQESPQSAGFGNPIWPHQVGASLLEMNLSMRRVGVAVSSVVVIQILTIE